MSKSKADEAALELIKQLITLTAGVLALSAAFLDKLPTVPIYMLGTLLLAWAALVISMVCGLKTISAIVKSRLKFDDEWSSGAGKRFASCCQWCFVIGITTFAIFAFTSFTIFRQVDDSVITIRMSDPKVIEVLKTIMDRPAPNTTTGAQPQTDKTK